MSRYIDADKVSTDLKELFEQYILNDNMYLDAVDTSADVQKIIHSEPDALIHAHWIDRNGACVYTEWERYQCSNCKCNGSKNNYCSNCGARMR